MVAERDRSERRGARLTRGASVDEIAAWLASLNGPLSLQVDTDKGLVAARDHLGLAPLFTTWNESGGWLVADSVEAILHVLPAKLHSLNERSVVGHVSGLSAPRPDETFFSKIQAVAPGTITRLLESEQAETQRLWDPTAHRPQHTARLEEASSRLRSLITEVVGDYVPEGPIAAFLTSGIDSTAVLTGLAEAGADVHAITWSSPGAPQADQSEWARLVAEKLDVPLTEIRVQAESLLPEEGIVTRRSTPVFSMLDQVWQATYEKVADLGRPVLFTGLGGDHLFGRWVSTAGDLLLRGRLVRLSRYLGAMRASHPDLTSTLHYELASPIARQLLPRLWVRQAPPPPWLHPERIGTWRSRHRELIGPGLLPGYGERVVGVSHGAIPQLAEDLAAKAGPYGVELHSPLLDRRLVEFALQLPSWMLNNGSVDKLVLRGAIDDVVPKDLNALEDLLPAEMARRAMRARTPQLEALTQNMRSATLRYVSEPELAEYLERFLVGEHDDTSFWNALTFEEWLRRWW